MNDDDTIDDRPERNEFVWRERDRAELWASIVNDACIDPSNWQAAFRAALRGEPEWWLAIESPEEDGDGLNSDDETAAGVEPAKTIQHT